MRRLPAALALVLLTTACQDTAREPDADPTPVVVPSPDPSADDLTLAESEPVEDSYYPRAGDPGVDSLHYALDLTWDAEDRTLDGHATVTFRATADAPQFQLDLGHRLEVSSVRVDGEDTEFSHRGKDLVVRAPVQADAAYEVAIEYSGRPGPVPAPTQRTDFTTTGFTVTKDGWAWTMQEPYGAYTWYPVNDQPSDKALYDLTLRVDDPWTGVAGGQLVFDEVVDGQHVTAFHLDSPASSYLTTVAFGEFDHEEDTSAGGVPLSYWVPAGDEQLMERARATRPALEWLEDRLGDYPFSTAGTLIVPSESGMETQTLITLGTNEYVTSDPVLVHELTHQWFGDLVGPADWRDVWLNEGITMYLQYVYQAEHGGLPLRRQMAEVRGGDQLLRDAAGPPGAYLRNSFGSSNVYQSPALMWHELATRMGQDEFWAMMRRWPAEHAHGSATREELVDWVEAESGLGLSRFFDRWLLSRRTPPRGLLSGSGV